MIIIININVKNREPDELDYMIFYTMTGDFPMYSYELIEEKYEQIRKEKYSSLLDSIEYEYGDCKISNNLRN